MAIVLSSAITLSTNAYTKTANLVIGRNQFVQKGRLILVARGSAAGMNTTVNVGGVALVDDAAIPFFGATGTLSNNDHIVCDQVVAGGTVELYLRNTSAGALTTDYTLLFTPM
jgi:hypothetical protein